MCVSMWCAARCSALLVTGLPFGFALALCASQGSPAKRALPRPQRLDREVEFRRDPAGELRSFPRKSAGSAATLGPATASSGRATIHASVSLVEVNCQVLRADGSPLLGLRREDFRLFEDGVEQTIAHFDASTQPASIALLLDASPSVFRELGEMKTAARALVEKLAPGDEVAVVSFAGSTHLLLPFTRDRALLGRALTSQDLAQVADSRESNIYRAVYLSARELFSSRATRPGRKAIVLLTDGQDSGLGLGWDPASALPQPGKDANRLTFEDVARALAAAGIELYAISTQPRPKAMPDGWLEAHRGEMLVTPAARELDLPHYTLYLAEMVRRVGGRLYFLEETGTLSGVYRRIAETLSAEYTLGFYSGAGLAKSGWRTLRVKLLDRPDARITHRAAYYLPASR